MKVQFDNGQVSFSFYKAYIGKDDSVGGHDNGLRIQIYYPRIKTRFSKEQRNHKELNVSFPTCLRIVSENSYFGFGWEILGFGFAFDYQYV